MTMNDRPRNPEGDESPEKTQRRSSFEWVYWLQWVLATTLGWALGALVFATANLEAVGLGVGVLQWLVLRQRIRGRIWWWIVASTLGWLGGALLVYLLRPSDPLLAFATQGVAISVAQWLVLRRWVYRADWWMIIGTLAWTVGLLSLLGPSLVGTVVGGVTGWALQMLLQNPRPLNEEPGR